MLQVQYHSNFKVGPTLLFAGTASDVCQLLAVFQNWKGEEIDLLQQLRQVGVDVACDKVNNVKLSMANAKKDSYLEWTNDRGVWWISTHGQLQIVGLLEGLRDSAHPGHQYLDVDDPKEVQIMCSKEEHPASIGLDKSY